MGWSDKKQTTTSNSTSNMSGTSTTTPNVPDWLQVPAQGLTSKFGDIAGTPAGFFAPQTTDLQQQAWTGAQNMQTDPSYSAARGILTGMSDFSPTNITADKITGQSLLTGLDQYYNPFKDQVLNPALADFDYQAGQTRAGQAAQAAAGKAFQGSRYGVQEAQTEGDLARARAATEGGLLGQMYTQATGLSSEDAARRQAADTSNQSADLAAAQANQQAAQAAASLNASTNLARASQLADIKNSEQSNVRQNLAEQATLGGQQADTLNQIRQYPIQDQQQLEGLFAGLDPSLFTGQTTTSSGTQTSTGTGTTTGSQGLGAWLGDMAVAAAGGMGKAAMMGA